MAIEPLNAQSLEIASSAAKNEQRDKPIDPNSELELLDDLGVEWPDAVGEEATVAGDDSPDGIDRQAHDPQIQLVTETQAEQLRGSQTIDYRVEIRGLSADLSPLFSARFRELSALRTDRKKKANVAQINRRAQQDKELLTRLARTEGYYNVELDFELLADGLNDNGPARLLVRYDMNLGQLYKFRDIKLDGLAALSSNEIEFRDGEAIRIALGLFVGDPVLADKIEAGTENVAATLSERGYAFSTVSEPELLIDHAVAQGDLQLEVTTGSKYWFGKIESNREKFLSSDHLQRIAQFRPGSLYRASGTEDLRRAIIATGLVSTVSIKPIVTQDPDVVDVEVEMTPAPLRTIAGALGYGTGEGFRSEISWEHRNFFPPEGLVRARAVIGTQEQAASLEFRRNNFLKRDQVLNAQLRFSNINRNAFQARTYGFAGSLERQTNLIFQKEWRWSAGIELLASDERDVVGVIGAQRRRSFLIGALPASLNYDGTQDLLDPKRGVRLGLFVSPELSFQGGSFSYVRGQFDASVYQPLGEKITLAARTRLGTIAGSSSNRIAPSRRFYAGGAASVRGFGFQSIGPRDANNDPIGGKSLTEFSLEARVRVGNFGIVPFVDAGNISSGSLPGFSTLRFGAGLGVRYHTNFGPIRLDIGTPINPQTGDSRVAVYVSLGQAF